jgi:hypothetical protein
MSSKFGVLCTLSEKRLRQIEASPELVPELVGARSDGDVPGLLDLDEKWDALDVLLSDRGRDPILGDAILARSGRAIGPDLTYGKARILTAKRVAEIAAAIRRLSRDVVRARFESLHEKAVHGDFGREDDDAEELGAALAEVVELYAAAAEAGHGMLAAVV